jgi:putative chitinase
MVLTAEMLIECLPFAKKESIQKFLDPLNKTLEKFAINTPKRAAAFIAQLGHESDNLNRTVENLNYSEKRLLEIFPKYFDEKSAVAYAKKPERIANKVYSSRYGNRDEASGDGWKYKGRGPIQITFHDNYEDCGKTLGLDLVKHPELLEVPLNGMLAAGWYWSMRGLNALADRDDFKGITKKINGGSHGYPSRLVIWARSRKALNVK